MDRARGPQAALAIVRMASLVVSSGHRAAWRAEWEGELWARWEELASAARLTPGARLDLLWRAVGSAVDALTYRDGRWSMAGFAQDVRLAARSLRRRPGFAAVVGGTLALGIGAATAIFGVARDVLLRPFPYPDPDKVVAVQDVHLGRDGLLNVAYPNIVDLDAEAATFEEIGAAQWWRPALEHEAGSVVLRGAIVTANFFTILGIEAGEGRFFLPHEDGEGRAPLVVLSHPLWVERFGADPAVVGRDVRLSGLTYRVIGVTPAEFEDPWIMDGPGGEPQIWRTVSSAPSEWSRSGRNWRGIGRVRADVDLGTAQDELRTIFARLAAAYPEDNANRDVRITPVRALATGSVQPVLGVLLASVGVLLLIACTNLTNVLLGHTLDRRPEIAVHRAFGAPAWRILGRSIAETGLLTAAGGAGGVVLAVWLGDLASGLTPLLPRPVTGEVDVPILAFALLLTLCCGLVCGAAPALHTMRTDTLFSGPAGARWSSRGRDAQRVRRLLLVGQLALTTTLLIGAGLLGRSLQRLGAVDLGLTTEGVVGIELHGSAWSGLSDEAAQAKWDALLDAIRAQPGVTAAGAIDYLPLGGDYSCDGVQREDRPPPAPGEGRCAEVRVVLPGALEAMQIPLLAGRLLGARDAADQPPAVVIDERMAREFWPGEDPLGARIHVHLRTHEVVGVVGNMRHFGPGRASAPMLYLHAPQEAWNGVARGLAVVAQGTDTRAMTESIRSSVAGIDASIALGAPQTLSDLLDRSLAAPRFRTYLMVAFGATALLLSALGIAGLMSYSVARRRRELGVRLALGARADEVRLLVLREGALLGAVGIATGVAVALAISGALEALLYDVGARDPGVYGAAVTVLAIAAAAACYGPARRASRLDPVEALAAE